MRARGRRARVIRRDSTRAMVEVGETWCEKNAKSKEKKTLETRVRIPAMESKISVPSWSRGMDSSFSDRCFAHFCNIRRSPSPKPASERNSDRGARLDPHRPSPDPIRFG